MNACNRHLVALIIPLCWSCALDSQPRAQANPCKTELTAVQTRFWIPVIGHGMDPSGIQFDTIFKVINLQETPVSFEIYTCSDSGEVINLLAPAAGSGPPVSSQEVSLAGSGIATLKSLNATPQTHIDTGWAMIDSRGAIGVEVIFNIHDGKGFFTSTNVRVGILHKSTTFFAEISPTVNTGVAFLYPPQKDAPGATAPQKTVADIILRDDEGAIAGQTTIELNKSEKKAVFLGQLLQPAGGSGGPSTPAFSGTVEVKLQRADDPQAAEFWSILPLRQEGLVLTTQIVFPPRSTDFETARAPSANLPDGDNPCMAPIPEGSRAFFVPLIAHGTDPSGNRLDTVFKVINLSSNTANLRIVSCDDSGQMSNLLLSETEDSSVSLIDFSVPGNGSKTLYSRNSSPSTALNAGWGLVTTPDFAGLEVIFNIVDPQNFLTSTNVPIPPVVTAVAFFADIGPGLNTGVSFVYPGAQFLDDPGSANPPPGVNVRIFLRNEKGELIKFADVVLKKGQKKAQYLGELLSPGEQDTQNFAGSVDIRVTPFSVPVAVLPLRQEGLVLTTQALFPPRVIREQSNP